MSFPVQFPRITGPSSTQLRDLFLSPPPSPSPSQDPQESQSDQYAEILQLILKTEECVLYPGPQNVMRLLHSSDSNILI